jgi:hypothetical protein
VVADVVDAEGGFGVGIGGCRGGGGGGGEAAAEVGNDLFCAVGFPGRWVAGYED